MKEPDPPTLETAAPTGVVAPEQGARPQSTGAGQASGRPLAATEREGDPHSDGTTRSEAEGGPAATGSRRAGSEAQEET